MEIGFLKTQQWQPFIWLRDIDDILFIWTHGEEQLNFFFKDLNDFHSNLKFTSQKGVDFVDFNVSLKGGAVFTDLHIKPTDGHQFQHYKSSHPSHKKKKKIPLSQSLKISRLCSSQNGFNGLNDHFSNVSDWFLARDYPQKLVNLLVNKSTKQFLESKQLVKILLRKVRLFLNISP